MLFGAEHVKRYQETDGEVGHEWERGTTILLLTVTGRKSGKQQTSPLIYTADGDDRYIVIASKGGADTHPDWFLNLQANPDVEVQVKGDKFKARAHAADAQEKAQYWPGMVAAWPDYDNYQNKTSREIPLVVLDRA
jgi:deazaflavin-dependent oxidoreductase (nitroreductase family)